MDVLLFFKFFAFLAYCYLFVFVLWKDPKSKLNRVCAVFLASCIIWVFTDFFILNINSPEETAVLFNNIGSIGWIGGSSYFLWFTLIFTEKEKILKSKLIFPFLFIPPALLIYIQFTGLLTILIKAPFGWLTLLSNSVWPYLFFLYYLSFSIGAVYLLINFKKKTKELIFKKQAGIFIVTILISIVFGSLTDALLPNLNVNNVPPIMNIIVLIWAASLVYAINKYKLMTITPALAAENIISTMADSLILLDKFGKIVKANKASVDLSGYKENELTRKSTNFYRK
jgi:PAS domain-containing protein